MSTTKVGLPPGTLAQAATKLLRGAGSCIRSKWNSGCQGAILILPAVIAIEANRLNLAFHSPKTLFLAGITYLGAVVWIVRGRLNPHGGASRTRDWKASVCSQSWVVTFVAAALLAFALYLWPQVRYFDLSKTDRRALSAWSSLSEVYLSLLRNEIGRWDADVEAIYRLPARTGDGEEQRANLRDALLRGIQAIELPQRELAQVAKYEPKGVSIGDYPRKILLPAKLPSVLSTNVITRHTPAELLFVRARASGSRSLRRQAVSGLAYGAVVLAQVAETFSHSMGAGEGLLERGPRTSTLPAGTDPLTNQHGADGFEVARKIIERRKRVGGALEDLLHLTHRLTESLSAGSVSNEDVREMEDRLRAFGISLK